LKLFERKAASLLEVVAALLLLLALSAFASPPHASAHVAVAHQHTGYKVLPGQELVIPVSTQNGSKIMLHLKAGPVKRVSLSSLSLAQRAGSQIPLNSACGSAYSDMAGYDIYGIQLWDYNISFTYCWQNGFITYIGAVHPSVSTLWPWGVSHHEYSAQEKTWGYGGGNYTASMCCQSHSGYVEADVYGNGTYASYFS
jgi:hypothetical protein